MDPLAEGRLPCGNLRRILCWVPTNFFPAGRYTGPGGEGMAVYLDLVVLLNYLVDFLLLLGTNRLSGFPLAPGRCAS